MHSFSGTLLPVEIDERFAASQLVLLLNEEKEEMLELTLEDRLCLTDAAKVFSA